MKNLIILIVAISIFSCQKEGDKTLPKVVTNDVVITGTIENYKLEDSINKITLYMNRVVENDQISDLYAIDSTGHFSMRFNMDRQQDVFIRYKNSFSLILKPSDSINLVFDGEAANEKELLETLKLDGSSKDLNSDFIVFQIESGFDHDSYYKQVKRLDNDAYKVYYDSLFTKQSEIITDFVSKNNVSDVLKNWLFVEQHYTPLDFLLGYPLDYSMYHNVRPNEIELSESFYEDLNDLPSLNETHLVNSVLKHVGNRYHYHFLFDLSKPGEKIDPQVLNSDVINAIISKNKNNPLLAQIALNDRITSLFENNSVDIIDQNKKTLDSLYSGSLFENEIAANYAVVKERLDNPELPEKAQLLTFSSEDPSTFLNEIIKNANGKVIYIDNWATWCGPCKGEFKESTPKLKKKFADDVEFVYLCHQSDEKLWKPTISEFQVEGKHYFITKEQFDVLKDPLNITGFPTYNIIDKSGEIAYSGFEYRPSIKKTSDILNELITP